MRPAAYRAASLERRLGALLRRFRLESSAALKAHLEQHPDLMPEALDTLLIGVTEFFRDGPVFKHLRRVVLPELLQSRRGVRVCAIGVSNGQELYSVAILLAEAGVLEHSRLMGVDCRPSAIADARRGWFGAGCVAAIDPPERDRYFEPCDEGWRVRAELRGRIEWRQADALRLPPEPFSLDLVLFRNVAIYLRAAETVVLWENLCAGLSPGGCLVTGRAEKPPFSLPLTRVAPCVFRRNVE